MEVIKYAGYSVLVYVMATNENHATTFADFTRAAMASTGDWVAQIMIDDAHDEQLPRLKLHGVNNRRRGHSEFQIELMVIEGQTAEQAIEALADALEPLGWGPLDYPRGAIHKQEQALHKLRTEAAGKVSGKPLYG